MELDVRWRLPASRPGLKGYLPYGPAHSINHIVVQDLGIKEVLVCACDDGDVVIYYTDGIEKAVKAVEGGADLSYAMDRHIKPLMIENVGKSAWGIAVHSNARLVAVSSNSHVITVFAFALKADDSLGHHGHSLISSDFHEEQDFTTHPGWIKSAAGRWRIAGKFDRLRDQVITLRGHDANIPSIAFFNSDADPTGQYLVSTDIYGTVIIWDVWERCGLKKIVLGPFSFDPDPGKVLGWSIVCIQPQSFRLASTIAEFLGCAEKRFYPGGYNVSEGRWDLKDSTIRPFRPRYTNPHSSSGTQGQQGALMSTEDPMQPSGEINLHMMDQSLGGVSAQYAQSDEEMMDITESEDEMENDIGQSSIEEVPPFSNTPQPMAPSIEEPITADFSHFFSPSVQPHVSEHAGPGNLTKDTIAPSSESIKNYHSGSRLNDQIPSPPDPEIPFFVLQTGVDAVSLLRPPFETISAVCHGPCLQELPDSWPEYITRSERLSMTHYIPDLGIVVVGNASGRAAIFTLTRKVEPAGTKRFKVTEKCAMRLDWIVPFASQENRKERPMELLVGVAVAPLQGGESRDEAATSSNGSRKPSDRWRMVLTYRDHSVLSYELWWGGDRAEIQPNNLRF